jgi:thiamine biosynthesis lipoprotein
VWKKSSALVLLFAAMAGGADLKRLEFVEPHMGTLFRITVYASDPAAARAAANAAFARVKQLDETLSDYNPESELSRLTRQAPGEWTPVSKDLFHILEAGQRLARDTGGAFDVTAGPLIHLWREARKTRRLPSQEAIAHALARSGYEHLMLDAKRSAARIDIPGMQLDPGAIAKGYAADAALDILKHHGLKRAIIAASGDLAIGSPPPGTKGWRVQIQPSETSQRVLILRNTAVSTSGDRNQFVEIDGRRYSHVVDARTGMALADSRGVTVIARRGIDADSLATAACILGKPIKTRHARYFN